MGLTNNPDRINLVVVSPALAFINHVMVVVVVFLSCFSCLSMQFWLPQLRHTQTAIISSSLAYLSAIPNKYFKIHWNLWLKSSSFSDSKVRLPSLTNIQDTQLNLNLR